ncbi:hypothetical protein LWC33_13005 [Pseudonocardia sp. RS11V-5]|uniref:hypothetical protein n=1 Tax=Pseudonocardia terrae TaxID=2905831 RepID=UPI001E62EFA8|nr:hypothetical protein [Pseudonocardia terrae]MCE3552376.1 hypothetical protein [Pseudonocardia terrae]
MLALDDVFGPIDDTRPTVIFVSTVKGGAWPAKDIRRTAAYCSPPAADPGDFLRLRRLGPARRSSGHGGAAAVGTRRGQGGAGGHYVVSRHAFFDLGEPRSGRLVEAGALLSDFAWVSLT